MTRAIAPLVVLLAIWILGARAVCVGPKVHLAGTPTITVCTSSLGGIAGDFDITIRYSPNRVGGPKADQACKCLGRVDAVDTTTCYLTCPPKESAKVLLPPALTELAILSWPKFEVPENLATIRPPSVLGPNSVIELVVEDALAAPNKIGLVFGDNCDVDAVNLAYIPPSPPGTPTGKITFQIPPLPVPACVGDEAPVRIAFFEYEGHIINDVDNDRRLTYNNFLLGVFVNQAVALSLRACPDVKVTPTETLIDICGDSIPYASLLSITLRDSSAAPRTAECGVLRPLVDAVSNVKTGVRCRLPTALTLPLSVSSIQLNSLYGKFSVDILPTQVVATNGGTSPRTEPAPSCAFGITTPALQHIRVSTDKLLIQGDCLSGSTVVATYTAVADATGALHPPGRDGNLQAAVAGATIAVQEKSILITFKHPEPMSLGDQISVYVTSVSGAARTVVFEANTMADDLKCLRAGDNSTNNGWWITYKSTRSAGYFWGDAGNVAAGLKFDAGSWETSPVYHTLQQLYPLGTASGVNYMIYNEQWKIDKRIGGKISDIYPGPYSKCGHLKGAIAWNASGKGFWITHSYPNFPRWEYQEYIEDPARGAASEFAQHFMCVPIDSIADLERILEALEMASACVGARKHNLASTSVKLASGVVNRVVASIVGDPAAVPTVPKPTFPKTYNLGTPQSQLLSGVEVMLVYKNNQAASGVFLNQRLMWDDLMRDPAVVTNPSWLMGNMVVGACRQQRWFPSCCRNPTCFTASKHLPDDAPPRGKTFVTTAVSRFGFPALPGPPLIANYYLTDDGSDHSKWGFNGARFDAPGTSRSPIFCVSDLNRQQRQTKRGGISTCIKHEHLWRAFAATVDTVHSCTIPALVSPVNSVNADLTNKVSVPPGSYDWTPFVPGSRYRQVYNEDEICYEATDGSPYPCERPRIFMELSDFTRAPESDYQAVFGSLGESPYYIFEFQKEDATERMGSYSLPWDDLDNPNPLELNAWVYFREDTHYAWQIFEFSITQYVRIEGALIVSKNQDNTKNGGLLFLTDSYSLHHYWRGWRYSMLSNCRGFFMGRELSLEDAQRISSLLYNGGARVAAANIPAWIVGDNNFPSFQEPFENYPPLIEAGHIDFLETALAPMQKFIVLEAANTLEEAVSKLRAHLNLESNEGDLVVRERKDGESFLEMANPAESSFFFFRRLGEDVICTFPEKIAIGRGTITLCSFVSPASKLSEVYIGRVAESPALIPKTAMDVDDVERKTQEDLYVGFQEDSWDSVTTQLWDDQSEAQPSDFPFDYDGGLPDPEYCNRGQRSIKDNDDTVQLCNICSSCCSGGQPVASMLPPKCLTTGYAFSSNEGFVVYKIPQQSGTAEMMNGTAYLLSESGSELKPGEYSFTWKLSPIELTLKQFSLATSASYNVIAYRSRNEPEGGLGNGLIALGPSAGIWITHSRGIINSNEYEKNVKAYDPSVADIWTCIPIDVTAVDAISDALIVANVEVYNHTFDANLRNMFPSINRLLNSTRRAEHGQSIGLFEPLITKGPMLVKSRDIGGSTCTGGVCSDMTIRSPGTMSFPEFREGVTASWLASTNDQSVWGVSCSSSWVCFVDAKTANSEWPMPALSTQKPGSIGICYESSPLAQSLRTLAGGSC